MDSIFNTMTVPGVAANLLYISVFGIITVSLVIWCARMMQKKYQTIPVSFYQRRICQLTNKHRLSPKDLEILRDFSRMEKSRRQEYYNYLNRNSGYF